MLCHLKEWEQLLQVVNVGFVHIQLRARIYSEGGQETIQTDAAAVDTYEAIADILVSDAFGSFE